MDNIEPEDLDPLRRRGPKKVHPSDLDRGPSLDLVTLIRQLLVRIERLEEDMRVVKKKLNL